MLFALNIPKGVQIALLVVLGIIAILLACYLINKKQVDDFIMEYSGIKRIQKKLYKGCKERDYLTISQFLIETKKGSFNKIDTLIIGNKFIYLVSIVKNIGDAKVVIDDDSWRIIHQGKLTSIDNPLIRNRRIRASFINNIGGIEEEDVKGIICFSKGCKFNKIENTDNEFFLSENDVVKFIAQYEKKSKKDIIDPKEQEKYITFFYNKGMDNTKYERTRK